MQKDENNEQIYYHNKIFATIRDLQKYAEKWPDEPCDIEYFDTFFYARLDELKTNASVNKHFTNKMALQLLAIYFTKEADIENY